MTIPDPYEIQSPVTAVARPRNQQLWKTVIHSLAALRSYGAFLCLIISLHHIAQDNAALQDTAAPP